MEQRLKGEPKTDRPAELDTEEISILLIGDEAERKQAIELIDKHLQRAIARKIRYAAPGLPPDELLEVYGDVLLGVWKAAKEGRFDPDRPLLPFLFTLAQRKAYDRLRKRSRVQKAREELLDAVAERLAGTEVGAAWEEVVAREDGQRMNGIIRDTVARMPARQRQVASVVIECFPSIPTPQEIRQEIYETTGEQLTVVAVKRAWQEARAKLREQLVLAGYMESRKHGTGE